MDPSHDTYHSRLLDCKLTLELWDRLELFPRMRNRVHSVLSGNAVPGRNRPEGNSFPNFTAVLVFVISLFLEL
ncbi:unnamed protein product [Protopolystoma xenopodis]|uniref:Uncharacterized protein n=1 Tax=Protopolystoma xenopodis TaxID=117903 RepID=A0A448WBZ0_9PLAT|nr:unnamed protein product [Protopolystoma xenopodis]